MAEPKDYGFTGSVSPSRRKGKQVVSSMSMPEDLWRRGHALARKRGVSLSALVRSLLQQELELCGGEKDE